jgi:hypothetical protein
MHWLVLKKLSLNECELTNTDNVINDNSTIIASPVNLGFPKGIATTPNAETEIRVINP